MRSALRKRGPSERGAALILVVVVIAVLALVAFAVVQSGSNENDAVAAKRHYDEGVSCADAARELLLSQFRAYGVNPTDLQLDQTMGDMRLATRHYDSVAVTKVQAATGYTTGSLGASDLANRIVNTRTNQAYRLTVTCSSALPNDAGTRQSEVEFVTKFGL